MKFEILKFKQTPKVEKIENVREFLEDKQNMIELNMFNRFAWSKYGLLGLAANQTLLDGKRFMKNYFIMRVSETLFQTFFNPQILEYVGEPKVLKEGCFTWPKKVITAERYDSIILKYSNETGQEIIREYEGLEAQVIQHEVNHLNGVEEIVEKNEEVPIKVGRNEMCPCGSGKKFKNCCQG